MELGKHVVDKAMLDCDGRRAGLVDELLLEIRRNADGSPAEPRVVAIVSGPLALSGHGPAPLRRPARWIYRLLGLADPHPAEMAWTHVTAIDVVVHLDVSREQAGLTALADAVRQRYIGRIPGA
jgi:hypothetical protein